ncbi:LytR/AlgR family response regulator transcription factor [Undibacterium rugosum]|uniref:LytR/AlgR family response regulator transcription factor n=1 Tax=Undibacterium rugosum TaxID=2762291 RepID=UPI001B8286F5|nr:response regulator [Undibacterium rugosum]MBR7777354.1 response regulator [Undibacterium rugosum]
MTPIRLYIVDDELPARQRLQALLGDIAPELPHQLIGDSGQAMEALVQIQALKPDVILLDVQMPELNGIEFAEKLHTLMPIEDVPDIIFVTAYEEYALRAFDVHASDYLLKPVRAARLAEALKRVASRAQTRQRSLSQQTGASAPRQHFSVAERGRITLVPVTEVLYLKAEQKYVSLHTAQKDYLIEESLTALEEEFCGLFVRVHRNALVARAAIAGVEKTLLIAESGSEQEKVSEVWQLRIAGSEEKLLISRRQWAVIKTLLK